MPSLGIKIERDVNLASLVLDLRLLNGISVSRFLQCCINLGSSFQYQNYLILLLCWFLSTCSHRHSQNSRLTLGWKSVHSTRSTVSICVYVLRSLHGNTFISGYSEGSCCFGFFLSVELIKYFFSRPSHIFWQNCGIFSSFVPLQNFGWTGSYWRSKRERQVFSDRDTDIKHKLIRHFLRKIPAPLSLTEWVTFAQECLCFLCKHLGSVILVSLL